MAAVKNWAKMLSEVLGNFARNGLPDVDSPRRVVDQLSQWAGHLSQNAARAWPIQILANEPCAFCPEDSMCRCIKCGDPICLIHGHVSYRAEAICDECVEKLLSLQDEPPKGKRASKRPRVDPVDEAFMYFNLSRSASFEEVTAVYKVRIRSAHPDRGGNTQAAAELNRKYGIIKLYFEQEAA